MSERSHNGPTNTPESTVGIAMILGETRSELRHQTEETARRFDELHADLAEETAAREALDGEHKEIIAGLTDVIRDMTAVVESLATASKRPVKNDTTSAETTMPTRARGEKNREFHTRLVAWARAQEYPEPPKPSGTEFPNAYDKRITAWIEKATSS